MGQRVDAESGLLDEEDTQDTSVDETTPPVTPAKTGHEHGNNQTHGENDLEVVAVLPDDNRVFVEIGDIGAADTLGVLLHDHPSQVRVEQTLADGVGVLVGIGITVVSPVITRPPADGTFDGTTTNGGEPDTERKTSRVGAVSPETMVSWWQILSVCLISVTFQWGKLTCGDTETSEEVIDDGPDSSLDLQGHPKGLDTAVHGDTDDEEDVQPVDMLVPVAACHDSVGNVDLLGVSGARPGGVCWLCRHGDVLRVYVDPCSMVRMRRRRMRAGEGGFKGKGQRRAIKKRRRKRVGNAIERPKK